MNTPTHKLQNGFILLTRSQEERDGIIRAAQMQGIEIGESTWASFIEGWYEARPHLVYIGKIVADTREGLLARCIRYNVKAQFLDERGFYARIMGRVEGKPRFRASQTEAIMARLERIKGSKKP